MFEIKENYYDRYEFFPLTILDTGLDKAKDEIKNIVETWWGATKVIESTVDLCKVNPPPEITPGGAHFIKLLIWEPKNNPHVTAVFVNLQDAYNSLIHVWNDRYKKAAITVRLSNDKICKYPHHEINVKTSKNDERVVYTHVESKWEFFQSGPVQDFENTDYYKLKRIKDKLDNNVVNEYMEKLGFEIWSEDFYTSNREGVYFEQLAWRK